MGELSVGRTHTALFTGRVRAKDTDNKCYPIPLLSSFIPLYQLVPNDSSNPGEGKDSTVISQYIIGITSH